MITLKRESIQTRNQHIVEDIKELRNGEKPPSLRDAFKIISEKHGISTANAQYIYYSKTKKTVNSEIEGSTTTSNHKESLPIDKTLCNNREVRIFLSNKDTYVVPKDLLKACGITYLTKDLTNLLNEVEHVLLPIRSIRGVKNTHVIRSDIGIKFLKMIISNNPMIQVKEAASHSLKDLQAYLNTQDPDYIAKQEENTSPVLSIAKENKSNVLDKLSSYSVGQKVDFTVTNILSRYVIGITKDKHGMSCIIYIGDVVDRYIQNLHDYFKVGETLTAIVKQVDLERKRLGLTTRALNRTSHQQIQYSLQAKESLKTPVKTTIEQHAHNPAITRSTPIPPVVKKTDTPVESLSIEKNEEWNSILNLICNGARVGALTPKAKEKLTTIINENGLVNVVSSIITSSSNFEADIGLAFLNEVENHIKKEHL